MSKRDGGPAFPLQDANTFTLNTGMSLRDWFAGMALQGALAGRRTWPTDAEDVLAEKCYKIADAMLIHKEAEL